MSKAGRFLSLLSLCGGLFLTSCEKAETPVTLPAKTGSAYGIATLGESYDKQIFWDFESNREVMRSDVASWDLCFESSASGYHGWMNGGKGVNIINSRQTDFPSVKGMPASIREEDWRFDDPSGQITKTAMGDWCDPQTRQTKGDVFIARLDMSSTTYYKFQLKAVTDSTYTLVAGLLSEDGPGKTYTLRKDSAYSRVYFSFTGTPQPRPDPPRTSWDVVFTRYRYIYYNLNGGGLDFPYLVTGVLLNPFNTTAAVDSVTGFPACTPETAAGFAFSNNRDAIGGMGWKRYNFTTERYETDTRRTYFLRNRNRQLFKFHFLDFYKDGVKGNPSFESERLQ